LQRALRNGVLTDFGKYSYGIYVYHVPVLLLCDFLIFRRLSHAWIHNFWFGVLCFAVLFAASFFVAKLSYEHFERHFLALKRYFEPSTSVTSSLAAGVGV